MGKKIEIFSFDTDLIIKMIKEKNNSKFEEMNTFKSIVDFLINKKNIMKKAAVLIIKSLSDYEEGIVKYNNNLIYTTSSFILTFKDIFNNDTELCKYNFEIEDNKIILNYCLKEDYENFYSNKILKSINNFSKIMTEEENYNILIEEIVSIFCNKIDIAYNFLNKMINTNEILNEDDLIKELFFIICEHDFCVEYKRYKEEKE